MQEHDRAQARRWRRASVALAAVAAAAITAAAVLAAPAIFSSPRGSSSVIDNTYSCRVQAARYITLIGGVTVYEDAAHNPAQKAGFVPAYVGVDTLVKKVDNQFLWQVFLQTVKKNLTVDRTLCRPSSRPVALTSAGLASTGTITPSFGGTFADRCVTGRRVVVRLHAVLTDGVPTRALLAVRNDDARSKPIAFVNWRPKRITPFLAKSCVPVKSIP